MTWKTKTLAELCKMYQPKTLSRKNLSKNGEYYVYGANGIIGKHDKFNHENSELLLGCRGTCGSIQISKPFSWINGNAMVIQPNESEVLKRYIEYYFKGIVNFSKITTGSTQPQITRESLNPVLISYPSLPEQQQIVSKLDILFAEIERRKILSENQKKVLLDLNKSFTHSVFDKFSSQLENKELQELCIKITDGVHKKPNYVDDGVPFLKINNLTKGEGISFENISFITPDAHQEFIKRTHPERNDILITKDGTIGVVRKVDTDIEFSIFVSLALIKPKQKKHSDYLTHVLRSPFCQNQLIPSGTALKHIYLKDLRKLTIPISSDEVNSKIVNALISFEKLKKKLSNAINNKGILFEKLKSAILVKELQSKVTI